MGKKLFEEDEEIDNTIKVDESFAKRFDHNNRRADLHRLKELEKQGQASVDTSDSDQSESDSDHSSQDVGEFLDRLIQVKNRNPAIFNDKRTHLFNSDDAPNLNNDKKKKEKNTYLKDVAVNDIEEGEEEEKREEKKEKGYYQEQEELRNAFLEAAGEVGYDGEILKEKRVPERNAEGEDKLDQKLEEYFGDDDKLNENSRFLKDYFRKKMWLEKDETEELEEEVDAAILDEYELDRQEKYEVELCYRHEENAGDRVMGHSRIVDGSVRKKSSTRKEQRQRKEERIREAEKEKREELKRLKNLKREEMAWRMREVMEAAGIKESSNHGLDLKELDEEFDPEEHDKMMSEAFDEEYYKEEDADPEFGSDGEENPNLEGEDELGEGFYAARERILKKGKIGNEIEPERGNPNLAVEEAREEMLEEYYKLDYEDTIGDLKTRFRYAKVDSNRYGLKVGEILAVDDAELNQYVSMKKLAPYRDEWKVPKRKRYEFKMKVKEMAASGGSKRSMKRKREKDEEQLKRESEEDGGKVEDPKEVSRQVKRRRRRQAELKISHSRRLAYGQALTKTKR